MALVRRAKARAAHLMPALIQHITMSTDAHPRTDAVETLPIKTLSASIRAIFGLDVSQQVAENMANGVNTFNADQFRKVIKSALSVDVFAAEPWLGDVMEASVAANVGLIESIPNKLLPEVEGLINSAYNGGMRVEDLADRIFGRFDVAESRAKLIARDQTSKLNGALSRLRQQNVGGDEYIWRTSQDERVREEHAAKEGQKFRWDDPPADTGNPGDDVQCRCYAEMVMPDKLAPSLDDERTAAVTARWQEAQND